MPADTAATTLDDVPAEPGASKHDPILVADDIRKTFGGLVAVDVEHLEVPRGVITALIGPNGAGKSTFFNLVSGFDDPDRGQWSFDGQEISSKGAHTIANMGMVRTFQLTKSLMKMSVIDNMLLAAPEQRGERFVASLLPWTWRSQEQDVEQRADELLDRFGLSRMRDDYAGTLSGGQRKLLEMARALMVNPRLIMLDEPMAGVNPALTQSLLEHVTALPDDGTTVLFVEHDMDVVMDISDWVVVMAEGRVIAEGRPNDITSNRAVIDAYLGEHHGESATARDVEETDR
ncbi:MAG: ABC transporter ATP-binding protein [Nitriliruptorales bacterium]|nr:ABC transporter ATP-binding protein [Nitriliruptorales bacterium]